MRFAALLSLCWLVVKPGDPVFYRSKPVPFESLARQPDAYFLADDKGNKVPVTLLLDTGTKHIYWYRRLFTEVCLTGECRPVDIGIYWTGSGKYLGIEVFRENLTKTDHSFFSEFDYRTLESALRDEWSPLREFEFEELVEEKKGDTDATTGATKKVIADASVKNAVYTTYTLWHLIHVGEGEQLTLLTYRYLEAHPELLAASFKSEAPDHLAFLLRGMLSGNLSAGREAAPVILRALGHGDAALRHTALEAVGFLPLDDEAVQNQIAAAYLQWAVPDKNRFLQSAARVTRLHARLYEALSADLSQTNAWFLASLLPVLAKNAEQSPDVMKKVRELSKSGNPQLEEAARKFRSGGKPQR